MRSAWLHIGTTLFIVTACGESTGSDDSTEGSSTEATSSATTQASGSEVSSSGPAPTGDADLVSLDGFTLVAPADDPFGDRPADDSCNLGYGLEDGLFEVDADICLYGAFSQPSLVDVRAGDTIEAVIVHDALYSEESGVVSHIGVAVGDEVAWETTIDIPAEAGFLRPTWEAGADAPAGTPIHFHLHNHGVNTYRLVAITVAYQ